MDSWFIGMNAEPVDENKKDGIEVMKGKLQHTRA